VPSNLVKAKSQPISKSNPMRGEVNITKTSEDLYAELVAQNEVALQQAANYFQTFYQTLSESA
jgi:hypothetical protein